MSNRKGMVKGPENVKTPHNSRGTSPARSNSFKNKTTSPKKNAGPTVANNSRKGQSPDRQRKATPDRQRRRTPERKTSPDQIIVRSRGNSPMKYREENIISRGSENGSIERLDDDNLQRIIASYNQDEDNINVVVRVRPLSDKEIKAGDDMVVQFPGNGQVMVDAIPGGPGGGQKARLFSYNVVFEPAATQEDVLQYSGMKRLIEMAVEGFRCTCFCYGQTGSGKTHTLTGPPGLFGIKAVPYSDDHGLVFRSFVYLFQLLQEHTGRTFVLKASFLEIYNEKVIDLLNPGTCRKPLAVRWSKKARGFFVENLFTVDCEELDDLMAVLEEGIRNRSVGRHNMNDYSSRSHTILSVHITSEEPSENGVFISRFGKINFVDLAGSEMTKKTQSEGKTLEEANNINKSLMVLGYCIASLSDPKRKGTHIPYRDSKLTKLLADSLAGNGVTLMIACISPARSNIFETINTLRYAARAKKIRTKPVVLMDPREALIISLKREVASLQSENEYLRSALNVYSSSSSGDASERRAAQTPPHVDLEELAKLEGPQLAELVRLYMKENEALRKDNEDLFLSRDLLQRDHEIVCRENERLLKKLEEVNSVCCRSPLIPARPAFSAEILGGDQESSSTNIWTNPIPDTDNKTADNSSKQIPESIQKELDKRQIGARNNANIKGLRKPSSNDDKTHAPKIAQVKNMNLNNKGKES
ncbi:unnamed protein product [Callosobruchus maculatus]|uniref:Kinesin-like protein n=1 Tax=Callosobruchus maculatus TaxID=64391 RepID=A0A653C260_CALMS|nr:unnamed protein product [Callosobruchus maculatus]